MAVKTRAPKLKTRANGPESISITLDESDLSTVLDKSNESRSIKQQQNNGRRPFSDLPVAIIKGCDVTVRGLGPGSVRHTDHESHEAAVAYATKWFCRRFRVIV